MDNIKRIKEIEDQIIEDFSILDAWEDRYEYIIDLGKKLPDLEQQYKTEENRIIGCQSTVWLVADYQDGNIIFNADSDALIAKGIISLLIKALSHHSSTEIISSELQFIDKIGLTKHLAQTRSNGLRAMIKQMKNYALAYKLKETDEGY